MFKSGCCARSEASVVEMETEKKKPEKEKDALVKKDTAPPKYKLTSFKARIGGEMIRLLFHKVKVPFEDIQIDSITEWAHVTPEPKWGKLPVLELVDSGTKIYSSTAISRLLAKRYGLLGKDDVEAAQCDELVEVCQELRVVWTTFYDEENQEKKEENKINFINTLTTYLPKFNDLVGEGSCWLVGDNCTWADLFVANFLDVCEDTVDKNLLNNYPALKTMKDAVFDIPEIKAYVKSRPETSH